MSSTRGRILKSVPPESTGRTVFDSPTWTRLAASLQLSPRELEIAQHVFDDEKELTIAHRLGISPGTVHTYLLRVYAKLDVHSRVELVIRIFQEERTLPASKSNYAPPP